jgi:hypothetical protein
MRKAGRQQLQVCSHPWIDAVELAMHRAIARKIRRQPRLYRRARRNLARWARVKRACPAPLREWKEILANYNMDAVLRILTRRGEEGNRLRSTAPFCDILTSQEVEAIWARYDQKRV